MTAVCYTRVAISTGMHGMDVIPEYKSIACFNWTWRPLVVILFLQPKFEECSLLKQKNYTPEKQLRYMPFRTHATRLHQF